MVETFSSGTGWMPIFLDTPKNVSKVSWSGPILTSDFTMQRDFEDTCNTAYVANLLIEALSNVLGYAAQSPTYLDSFSRYYRHILVKYL